MAWIPCIIAVPTEPSGPERGNTPPRRIGGRADPGAAGADGAGRTGPGGAPADEGPGCPAAADERPGVVGSVAPDGRPAVATAGESVPPATAFPAGGAPGGIGAAAGVPSVASGVSGADVSEPVAVTVPSPGGDVGAAADLGWASGSDLAHADPIRAVKARSATPERYSERCMAVPERREWIRNALTQLDGYPKTMAKDKSTVDPLTMPLPVPGAGLNPATMPAHWLLARLGKKVMRPGGLPVTQAMLAGLAIGPGDDVVDLAPGLGATVELVNAAHPASFRGLERGEAEAERARRLAGTPYACVVAPPQATGLPVGSSSVVYGEAVLSLETDATKRQIVAEAARLLRPGGRLGLHELLLTPEDVTGPRKREIEEQLTRTLRVRARPLTLAEWKALLEEGGFDVILADTAPLLLLSPPTVLHDEGLAGTARLIARTVREPAVLKRMSSIWRVFRRYRKNLGAVALVARKRDEA